MWHRHLVNLEQQVLKAFSHTIVSQPTRRCPRCTSEEVNLRCNLPTPRSPIDCRIFNVVTDLVPAVRKLDTSCGVLRSISYATINELYPESEWLRIYADGSRVEQRINAGTGVFYDIFSVYAPVGRFASAYDSEVEALRIALTQL
ncbi:hypothetical protein CDAR_418451 [Caerostris darwini]|uniref:Uncharacterized protein n=1 Tax=Caerostris darwini TaxID=1538125 RepID=A0AAV4MV03_9ARAC|nr:hypothetical protein CDAR_418451 [Caerostris darwini]